MKIEIPKEFENKLTGRFKSSVETTITLFGKILVKNDLEFFPHYTDHGIEHIQDVINTSVHLVSDESLDLMTEEDVCILIHAIVYHDLGLHLTVEGFKKLIYLEYDEFRVNHFDNKSWKELWNEFLYEAKRFNSQELDAIFGDEHISVKEPDLENIDLNSRLLIGEFIRRHHARLAHEIALGGFPTAIGAPNIQSANIVGKDFRDIAGLVARSHGMNVRDTFEYLKSRFSEVWFNIYNIKVIFLMIVLRIADYIQIQKGRASKVILKTKNLRSPISKMEWAKHNSVLHISLNNLDPERIFVLIKPESSSEYLGMRTLLDGIQYEFDLSWAILGEVYAGHKDFRDLKIKFRRITSNIDNKREFYKSINFVPERLRFDADPELLKLLIGPLYEYDPSYGIRELMQNSIDAINEREYLSPSGRYNLFISLFPDEKSNSYLLRIIDEGIGMSRSTILNYFFTAGASYRQGMTWRKNFVSQGESVIQKTGRFGVGVLAIFLIGDEFEMQTRYYNETHGYECRASLNSRQVELKKVECDIGTRISIIVKPEIKEMLEQSLLGVNQDEGRGEEFEKLDWFTWYLKGNPQIIIKLDEKLKKLFTEPSPSIRIPNVGESAMDGWKSFDADNFKDVQWRYRLDNFRYNYDMDETNSNNGELICNGFRIKDGYKIKSFSWKLPQVSVNDGNSLLPLSLNRDNLFDDTLPFENELIKDILNQVLSALKRLKFEKVGPYWVPEEKVIEIAGIQIDLTSYIFVKEDYFTLKLPFIFKDLDVNLFYELWIQNEEVSQPLFNMKNTFYRAKYLQNDPNYFYKGVMEVTSSESHNLWFSIGKYLSMRDVISRKFMSRERYQYMTKSNRLTKGFTDNVKEYFKRTDYIEFINYFDSKQFTGFAQKLYPEKEFKGLSGLSGTKVNKDQYFKMISKIIEYNNYDYFFVKESTMVPNDIEECKKLRSAWEALVNNKGKLFKINKSD